MLPEILGVNSFALTVLAAYVAALVLLTRRVQELDRPRHWVGEGALVATLSGLVGSHLYWLAQNPGEVEGIGDLLAGGGLTWYGGLLGGAVAVLLWGRWRGVPVLLALDSGALVLPVVQAIGRLGCQLSGDGDYGTPSDLPWAMGYPNGTVPTAPGVEVHPTPVYEMLALGAIGLLLWRRRDAHRPGTLFAAYLLLAGLERFAVEFLRRNEAVLVGLTGAQLISVALALAGGVALVVLTERQRAI